MLIIPFIGFFLASSFQKYLLLDDRVIASMVDGKLVPGEARKHPSNPGIVTNYPPFFSVFFVSSGVSAPSMFFVASIELFYLFCAIPLWPRLNRKSRPLQTNNNQKNTPSALFFFFFPVELKM